MPGVVIENPLGTLLFIVFGGATIYFTYRYFVGRGDQLFERLKCRWTALEAVTGTIFIYFWSQVLTAIVLLAIIGQEVVWHDSTVIQFLTVLTTSVMVIGLLYLFMRRRGAKPTEIGLKRPLSRDVGYALAAYAVYFVIFMLIVILLRNLTNLDFEKEQDVGFDRDTVGNAITLVFISLVILTPITEEIIMRGFLYTGLRSSLSFVKAGLITSLLFGLAHLQGGTDSAVIWVAAIDTFLLSLALVYLREKTGSLIAPIGLHMIKNAVAFSIRFVL